MYTVGSEVDITQKGQIVASGEVLEYEADDGYWGNAESWLKMKILATHSEHFLCGTVYAFRKPASIDGHHSWRKKTDKGMKRLGYVKITQRKSRQASE